MPDCQACGVHTARVSVLRLEKNYYSETFDDYRRENLTWEICEKCAEDMTRRLTLVPNVLVETQAKDFPKQNTKNCEENKHVS